MRQLASIFLFVFVGCTAPLPLNDLPCPCAAGWQCCEGQNVCVPERGVCPNFQIEPATAQARFGAAVQFLADRSPVSWRVEEGTVGGTIDAGGHYTAPMSEGTFHVVARASDGTEATAAVTVTPHSLDWIVGGYGGFGTLDGVGVNARFARPGAMAADADAVYVADTLEGRSAIRKIAIDSGVVTTLAGDMTVPISYCPACEPAAVDGVGDQALFGAVTAITLDGQGHLFAADGCLVRRIDLTTAAVTTLPTAAVTKLPCGIDKNIAGLSSDRNGVLYASLPNQHLIERIDIATGARTALAGSANQVGEVNGPFASAAFVLPGALLFASYVYGPSRVDAIFVADAGTVRVLYLEQQKVYSLTAGGPFGDIVAFDLVGNDLLALSRDGKLWHRMEGQSPQQIALAEPISAAGFATSESGTVYVSDADRFVVHALGTGASPLTVSDFAGRRGGVPGNENGPPGVARFSSPFALVDTSAGIFVGDLGGVRRVDRATGEVTTVMTAAGGVWGLDADESDLYVMTDRQLWRLPLSTLASDVVAGSFSSPYGIALDGAGRAFVIDSGDLREVDLATGEVRTWMNGDVSGLASDRMGHLFVATDDRTIEQIDIPTKQKTILADSSTLLMGARRLAYGGHETLFLAGGDSVVRKLSLATRQITAVVGDSKKIGVRVGTLPASLNRPTAVAVGSDGALLIADENALFEVR